MIKRVNHIGIAVRDLDATMRMYRDLFGVVEWERISLPERHMEVAVCHVGETMLEFIMPSSEQAAFHRFLAERGEGMHHIAYEVDELADALHTLDVKGVRLVDREGRPGIHNTCVAFLHPKATGGVLTELVELPARERDED